MEQEIVVLEAPTDAASSKPVVDEKYSLLRRAMRVDTVEAIRSLDEASKDLEFDSTIPSLMVQELLNYCIPIWDRFDEDSPPIHNYFIRMPLKRSVVGFVGDKLVGKSPGSADVIGLRVTNIIRGNRTIAIEEDRICSTLFMVGVYTLHRQYPRSYTQQMDMFPHPNLPPRTEILFIDEKSSMHLMHILLGYYNYTRYVYDIGITVYLYPRQTTDPLWKSLPPTRMPDRALKLSPGILELASLSRMHFMDFSPYAQYEIGKPLDERDTWWFELMSERISRLYMFLRLRHPDAPHLLKYLRFTQRIRSHAEQHAHDLVIHKEITAVKESFSRHMFGVSIRKLTAKQLALVEKRLHDYQKRKPLDADKVRIIREFQTALFGPTEDLRFKFNRLRKEIGIGKSSSDEELLEIYQLYLVCPHRIKYAQMTIDGVPRRDVIQTIQTEYSVSDLTSHFGFFCKICGEKIKRLDANLFVDFLPSIESNRDDLYDFIFREVLGMISSEIVFDGIISYPKIANSITGALYTMIAITERQLTKSNTILPEHIHDIMVIYISVYCMAVVIRMIMLNPSIKFREINIRGGLRRPHKTVTTNVPRLLAIAKNIIVRNNSYLFKRSNFKIEAIPSLLVKAYGWASSLSEVRGDSDSIFTGRELDLLLASSVIFHYLIDAAIYSKITPSKKTLLGRDDEVVSKSSEGVFSTVPIFDKWTLRLSYGYSPSLLEDMRNYEYRAFVKSMRYAQSMYTLVPIPEMDPRLVEFYAEYDDLRAFDIRRMWISKVFGIRTIAAPPTVGVQQHFYTPSEWKINLAQFYDQHGHPQKWDTAIYDTSDGEVAIPVKEAERWVTDPRYKNSVLIDMRNSKNGNLKSKVRIDDIDNIVAHRSRINDMLSYYNARCPLGDLHSYKDSSCEKCGYGSIKPDDYFTKYESAYQEVADKLKSINMEVLANLRRPRSKLPDAVKIAPWKADQNLLIKWAKLASTPFLLIGNLGASIGCLYTEFRAGKCVSDNIVARSILLKSYYTNIMRLYRRIKYDRFSVFSGDMASVFSVAREAVGTFREKMPDINPELVFAQLQYESADMQCNFLLNSIANLLLQIADMKPFGSALLSLITRRLLESDEELAKQPPLRRDIISYKTRYESDTDNESEDSNIDAYSDTDVAPAIVPTELFGYNDSDIRTSNTGADDDEDEDEDVKEQIV